MKQKTNEKNPKSKILERKFLQSVEREKIIKFLYSLANKLPRKRTIQQKQFLSSTKKNFQKKILCWKLKIILYGTTRTYLINYSWLIIFPSHKIRLFSFE